jgi:hypothetical protein
MSVRLEARLSDTSVMYRAQKEADPIMERDRSTLSAPRPESIARALTVSTTLGSDAAPPLGLGIGPPLIVDRLRTVTLSSFRTIPERE